MTQGYQNVYQLDQLLPLRLLTRPTSIDAIVKHQFVKFLRQKLNFKKFLKDFKNDGVHLLYICLMTVILMTVILMTVILIHKSIHDSIHDSIYDSIHDSICDSICDSSHDSRHDSVHDSIHDSIHDTWLLKTFLWYCSCWTWLTTPCSPSCCPPVFLCWASIGGHSKSLLLFEFSC